MNSEDKLDRLERANKMIVAIDRRVTWRYAQEPDGRRRLADCQVRITFEVMDGPTTEGCHGERP